MVLGPNHLPYILLKAESCQDIKEGFAFSRSIEVWQHKEGLIADQVLLPFGAIESNFFQ